MLYVARARRTITAQLAMGVAVAACSIDARTDANRSFGDTCDETAECAPDLECAAPARGGDCALGLNEVCTIKCETDDDCATQKSGWVCRQGCGSFDVCAPP